MPEEQNTRSARYEKSGNAAIRRIDDKNRKKPVVRKFIYFIIVTLLLVAFAAFCIFHFFKIENIIIDSGSRYNAALLTEKCGVKVEDNLLFVSEEKINRALCSEFPYIKEVKIRKELPSTIYIEIYEEDPEYYFLYENEYFIINSELKVLERFEEDDLSRHDVSKMTLLKLPDISFAVASDKVVFSNEFYSKHTEQELMIINKSSMSDKITLVDLSNRFELSVVYDERIVVEFGSYRDLELKLEYANKTLDLYSDKATGTLYVEDTQKGIAIIEENE